MNYELLINKNNMLNEEYLNSIILPSLVSILFSRDNNEIFSSFKIKDSKIYLESKTAESWYKLKDFINSNGILFDICCGYLSLEQQDNKYQDFLERNGEELTLKRISLPGYSEHHTGLAIDCDYYINGDWAGICEDENEETKFIHDNLHKFGFILRYPKGKENITGMQYEPWHIRYVGIDAATYIYEKELTFEEFYLEKYGVKSDK